MSVYKQLVTPEMAEMILTYAYDGQRKIETGRVTLYANDMKNGRWRLTPDIILIGKLRDSLYLLAGQHRLSAVVQSGMTIEMYLEERDYPSMDEMAKDYSVTNRGKNLTMQQALTTLGTAKTIGIGKRELQSLAAGINHIASNFHDRQAERDVESLLRNPDGMNRACIALQAQAYSYFQSLHNAPSNEERWGLRSSVCAAGLLTFYYQPQKSIEFWDMLWNNDGLRKGEPAHTLRTFLGNDNLCRVGSIEYAHRIASAWNHFMEGKPLNSYRGGFPENLHFVGCDFKPTDGPKFIYNLLKNQGK